MRVLIHADSLIRDPGPMLVLAELLRRRGHDVVVSSRLTTHFYVKFWRPHYLVHSNPAMVGSMWNKGLITTKGPRVGIIPQEGMERHEETMHAFYQNILRPGIEQCIDHIFMWNAYQRDWILSASHMKAEQVSVVGNVRLDLAKFGRKDRSRRGYVGFVGRFPALNKYDGSQDVMRLLLTDVSDRSERVLRNRANDIVKQVATVIAYGDTIHRLMRDTDYRISLRPHHEESSFNGGFAMLKARYGERIEIDRSLSIYDWSMGVDAIVSTTSNAFAEAYVAATPVVCIDWLTASGSGIDEDETPILESYDPELMPKDYPGLFSVLGRCMDGEFSISKNEKVEALMRESYSWPYAGSALAQVADRVSEAASRCHRTSWRLPAALGDLAYVGQVIRGRLSFRQAADKHYSRFAHGCPGYVVDAIASILAASD